MQRLLHLVIQRAVTLFIEIGGSKNKASILLYKTKHCLFTTIIPSLFQTSYAITNHSTCTMNSAVCGNDGRIFSLREKRQSVSEIIQEQQQENPESYPNRNPLANERNISFVYLCHAIREMQLNKVEVSA